jgi:hypothetical protein
MNRLAAALIPTVALGGCTSLPERSPGPSLDPLLAFTNPARCEPSPTLDTFLGGLAQGDAEAGFRPGRIVAPPQLVPHIGRIKVKKTRSYWVVSVRTRGSWLGMPVFAVHQAFPQGGDPGDFQFELGVPVAEAERRLRAAGFPAETDVDVAVGEPDAYAHLMTLVATPGWPRRSLFGCGYS